MENQAFNFTQDIPNRSSMTIMDGVSQQTAMNSLLQSYLTDHHTDDFQGQQAQNLTFYPYRRITELNEETQTPPSSSSTSLQENLSNLAISIPQIYYNSSETLLSNYTATSSPDSLLGCIGEMNFAWTPASFNSYGSSLSLSLATSSETMSFNSGGSAPPPAMNSGYLGAVQEILAQIASFALDQNAVPSSSTIAAGELGLVPAEESPENRGRSSEAKRAKLLALLQMVDDRYNQCVDEIHTVVSAFHAATELDPQVHARFALKTVSVMYGGLREKISRQCLAAEESEGCFESEFIQKQWALQQLKKKDHQLWRPQRGLPEKSVSVLRAWMFQNFLHPYPKDAEKHLLAIRSGLTRNQVSNWFINARVRLWKPMIEEMYAEMNRRKTRRNENNDNSQRSLVSSNNMQRHNV